MSQIGMSKRDETSSAADGLLSEEERRRLRAEEEFRHNVRESLKPKQSISIAARCWAFLNSQVVGWLLGTVLVGLTSFGYASHREAERAVRDDAQDDVELVFKLLPDLAKVETPDSLIAISMLKHLKASKGLSPRLAGMIDEALSETARASAEKASRGYGEIQRSAYVATAEAAIKALGNAEEATLGRSSTDGSLPVTVYMQIASEEQRTGAEKLRTRLRGLGLPVPSIVNRGAASPDAADVRYYFDSDYPQAEAVAAEARRSGVEVEIPRMKPPPPKSRPGVIEVWLGRSTAVY